MGNGTEQVRVLPAAPSATGNPGGALTGHVECEGPLCAHTSPGEGYPTGEVGAVVLRAGREQDL